MSVSLYDATVGTFAQILTAAEGFLEKGRAHFEEQGVALDEIVTTRLYPDMLPFQFQVVSFTHHSAGAIRGVKAGLFTPPSPAGEDYAALQQLVTAAREEIQGYSADEINALASNDVEFRLGDRGMPFTGEDFLLTFSLPNFYFHVTTAYDILRSKGVPIGKRDFMGRPRIKA